MTKPIPEEPKFVKNITSLQKIMAGVAVTMFLMVWITSFDLVVNIFKPDLVKFLTYLRVGMAMIGIALASCVGYPQLGILLGAALEMYEFYKKMSEIKKDKEK